MVTGRDLIEHGWPEGPTIGLALAAARKLRAAGIIHWSAWKGNSPKFAPHTCGWHYAERRPASSEEDTFYEHLPDQSPSGYRRF
jgi:hypothetical protein